MRKIFQCTFGSKLFGTNIPTSDDDRKGLFIADLNDIILNKDQETILEVDKEKGIDNEWKELRRFIWDACKGQTYALELLFAPGQFWFTDGISANDLSIWTRLRDNRDKIISRNVMPFIGFAIGQAQKYSLKGRKYNDLEYIIKWIEKCQLMNNDVFTKESFEMGIRVNSDIITHEKYVEMLEKKSIVFEKDHVGLNMTNFLGKKFYDNVTCKEVLKTLHAFKDRYGDRATQAAASGEVDFKAYYHSVRLLGEVEELMNTGKITLPRPDAPHLLDIRLGKIPYDDVVAEIDNKVEIAREKIATSNLPEKPDTKFWEEFIISCYNNPEEK